MPTARAAHTRERAGLVQLSSGSYRSAENIRSRQLRPLGGSGDTHADDRTRQFIRSLTHALERNAHTFAVLMGRWLDDLGTPTPRFASSGSEWNARMAKRWAAKAALRAGGWDSRAMSTWPELFRLIAGSVGRDGDVAAVKVADGTIAVVEADIIDAPAQPANQYRRTIGGITLDGNSRPTQLWVAPRTVSGFADRARARAYPWEQVEFCANRSRPSQTRGLPPLVAGLDDFERGDSLIESAVIQAEQAASVYGVIKRVAKELARATGSQALAPVTMTGKPSPVDTAASNDAQIPDYAAAARGALLMLYDDQEFSQVKNENPNLNVPPFMQFLLRLHALGLSYPYEVAFMDMGTLSWSAGKTLITLAREGMRRWREQVFQPFLGGFATWQLQRWIIEDGGKAPADWNAFEWDWPELPWPDPLKEEQTNALSLKNRTTSLRRITRHWREIMQERSEEETLQDTLAVQRLAAVQTACNAANAATPNLNLHWSHVVALANAGSAPVSAAPNAAPSGANSDDPTSTDEPASPKPKAD